MIVTRDAKQLKTIYMSAVAGLNCEGEADIEIALGMARYLEQLYHCAF